MDKPTTKHALLASSQRGFDELMGMIEQLSAKDRV
jgi:hypothetical protein